MSCELPTAQSAHTQKARRKHQCCECRGIIQPGETYHTFSGCWDGRWSTFKTCPDCQQLRTDVDKGHRGDEVTPFGYLHESAAIGATFILRFSEIHHRRNPNPWEWVGKLAAMFTPSPQPHSTAD